VSLILTVDCETFYDKAYSLSKITTEAYIRDPQFQVIGVSVAVGGGVPAWFSGTHAEIKTFLDQYDWESATAIAHNAAFDMAILNWVFDIRPKRIVDTLSMARALGHGSVSLKNLVEHYGIGTKGTEVVNALGKRREDFTREDLQRYGEYCQNDVWVTYRLFGAMASGFPLPELKLIDLTIRMFTEPVLELDKGGLESHLWGVQRYKQTLMLRISPDKDTLMSNPKFAEVLEKCGVTPPVKVSKTTGKETYAFAKSDEAFIALLEHENPDVQTLVAARLGIKSTLEETRTERFIEIAKRGAMPVPLRYYGAHTGRWSGCLVDGSVVTVYSPVNGVEEKRIVDVLADDLVWDGTEFVAHEGVVFSGFAEVIEWDGVKGTEDHVVFTDAGEMSLRDAMQGAHRLTAPARPDQHAVDAARKSAGKHKK
jgi:DNA polymerase